MGGTCGSVHKEHLEQNLEELQVLKSKWNGIRERLVGRLLEEQDKASGATMQRSGEDKRKRAQEERRQDRCTWGEVYVTCRDMNRK